MSGESPRKNLSEAVRARWPHVATYDSGIKVPASKERDEVLNSLQFEGRFLTLEFICKYKDLGDNASSGCNMYRLIHEPSGSILFEGQSNSGDFTDMVRKLDKIMEQLIDYQLLT